MGRRVFPTGWTSTPTAVCCFSSVYSWKGKLGLGRARLVEVHRALSSDLNARLTEPGEESDPSGASAAAWYRGFASKA